jgi:hypothetical protein
MDGVRAREWSLDADQGWGETSEMKKDEMKRQRSAEVIQEKA